MAVLLGLVAYVVGAAVFVVGALVARAWRRRRRFDRAALADIGRARYVYKPDHVGERPELRYQAEARRADAEQSRRHAKRIDTGDARARLEAIDRKRA